jgi:hypothetical protein
MGGLTQVLLGVPLLGRLTGLRYVHRSPDRRGEDRQPVPAGTGISQLLRDPSVPRSEWSISKILAIELAAYLERVRPRRILEVGSGFSTAILAAYALEHGAEVVTLEHKSKYHALTANGLANLGLEGPVDLRLAELRPLQFGRHELYQWYDVSLDGEFDFVFVDGPPKVMGRRGVYFAVRDHLRPRWRMWLDDGLRNHERKCIRQWEEYFPGEFVRTRMDIDGKGVFILRDAKDERDRGKDRAISGHLGIGIMGNGGSGWWRRAKRNLGDELLDSSYVVVMARDTTPAGGLPDFVDQHLPADGQGIRPMFEILARQSGVRYVLYLDDQWSPATLDESWLGRALDILEGNPEVDQVSLQHGIDVIGRATGQIFPQPFALEPSLLRVDRLELALQSGGRKPAPPLRTEQLFPGVFRRASQARSSA